MYRFFMLITALMMAFTAMPASDTPYYEDLPGEIDYKPLSSDTVIIADSSGMIIGGYSDGIWLSHSEAARFCGQSMNFYKYNLSGFQGISIHPGTVTEEIDGYYCYSSTIDMSDELEDERGCFNLGTPDIGMHLIDYAINPLGYTVLCSAPPERVPSIKVISDTSDILPVIQKIVDENFGKDIVEAQIITAVSVDLDGDGTDEIIVNSDNIAKARYWDGDDWDGDDWDKDEWDDENAEYWFSIACIINSDGTVHIIEEYFEKEDLDYAALIFAQSIIDIDGDGKYEIICGLGVWEFYGMFVYKYDGKEFAGVLYYNWGI